MLDKELYKQIIDNDKELKAKQYEEDCKVYQQLRSESKTYGELKKKIVRLDKNIKWEDLNCDIGIRLIKILEKEKNDLPLTNRSN